MKPSFTLGAVSGITALAVGFPIAAQFAAAQSSATATPTGGRPAFHAMAPLSQDEVLAMVDRDNQVLLHIDELVAVYKEAVQNHRIALQAAADIEDETARNDAVKAAHEAMRKEIEEAVEANPDLKDAMPFGPMKGKGARGPGGKWPHGFGPEKLAEKLGMTADQLKAALDSGKTPDEIAEEKGITLPARPAFGGPRR